MNSAQEKGGRERAGKRKQQFIIWYDKNKLTIFSHCFVLVEKLGQWAVTIGKDSSSSKMEKFIRNTFFQLCLCIFSTLITNVLFKKPFPLCAFSLKKSASISISLGYYESFRKKSFSNSDRAFFQLWSRGRVSKKYHTVLHFHWKFHLSTSHGSEMAWISKLYFRLKTKVKAELEKLT